MPANPTQAVFKPMTQTTQHTHHCTCPLESLSIATTRCPVVRVAAGAANLFSTAERSGIQELAKGGQQVQGQQKCSAGNATTALAYIPDVSGGQLTRLPQRLQQRFLPEYIAKPNGTTQWEDSDLGVGLGHQGELTTETTPGYDRYHPYRR